MKTKSVKLLGKVICRRTSLFSDDEKPCDEAVRIDCVFVDRRTIDDPMKNIHIGESWYRSGRNHRVEGGMIARDLDDKVWVVEINSSDDLESFLNKYGDVVLSIDNNRIEPCFKIEIYDTYRE